MRQIKFRAWNGKSMITPTAIINGKAAINKPCDINDKVLTDEDGVNYYCNWDIDKTTDYPLMQFTGLTDKNGVEIYEGDIVSDHVGIGEVKYSDKHAAFRVVYGDGMAKWFHDYNLKGERESIEVIGNKHQNTELLEQ